MEIENRRSIRSDRDPPSSILDPQFHSSRFFEAPDGIDVVRRSSQSRFHGVES